jgi:hypothetical protein
MKFAVTALESVEEALASLFMEAMEASNQQAITDAANWFERELKHNPRSKVTPVDNVYFVRRDPLVALCEIREEDRVVNIIEIHRIDEA